MLAPRNTITATLLRDGTMLVAGGIYQHGAASVELYDPGTGSWTVAGNLVRPETTYDTATRMLDGTVLLTGGGDDTRGAELYDPGTGTWTATGNTVGDRRSGATATLLSDGRVLLAGGLDSRPNGVGLASAELYDSATGTWTATVNMATRRAHHTATLLQGGRVLVTGGGSSGAATSELCDPGIGN